MQKFALHAWRAMSVASRVAKLSHAALVELVVAACEESPAIKNRADALVAQVAPLPAWCVEVLLLPDLLSACFSSLKLTDARVAATCRAWRTAWKGQLIARRVVLPTVQSTIAGMPSAFGLCVRGDGTLAVSCSHYGTRNLIRFVSSDGTVSFLAKRFGIKAGEARKFPRPQQISHFDDALIVSDFHVVRKIGTDGIELASELHPDTNPDECMPQAAIHQPSGVLLVAVTLGAGHGLEHVVLQLDAATLEPRLASDGQPSRFGPQVLCEDYRKHVAVDGDLVLVTEVTAWAPADERREPKDFTANILHVFNIDGTLVRTIRGCGFGPPVAMVADQGRVYVIESTHEATQRDLPEDCEEYDWAGRRLFVIDLETGRVLQKVRLKESVSLSGVVVHDGRVFLSDFQADCVFVLSMAHSEPLPAEAYAPSMPLHGPDASPVYSSDGIEEEDLSG